MEKFVAWFIDTAKWVAVCAIMVSILLAMFILLPPARAEDNFIDVIGNVVVDEIKQVNEAWIIPVETKYGIICFYSDNPEWEGEVYLLLLGKDMEIIDAFMINTLEAPFGEFSFFILTDYSI